MIFHRVLRPFASLIKNKNRKKLSLITGFIYLLLLVFIFVSAWKNQSIFLPYIRDANFGYVVGAIGFYFVALTFAVLSWVFIIREFIPEIQSVQHIKIFLTTLAARRLPGTFWYVGGRIIFYQRMGANWLAVSVASAIEVALNTISGCLLGLLLIPIGLKIQPKMIVLLLLVGLAGLFLIHPKILNIVMTKLKKPLPHEIRLKTSFQWLFLYVATRIASGVMLVYLIQVFRGLSFYEAIVVTGMWAISTAAGVLTMFLPSSLGATEVTLTALLSTIIPLPLAATIAMISRLLTTLLEFIIGGIFYLLFRPTLDKVYQPLTSKPQHN